MKDIKQIYRDKTGQWREVNHNQKHFFSHTESHPIISSVWQRFEDNITYCPFPNAPDTNEIVEAYLQWQFLAPNSLHPTWQDVEDSENDWRVDYCKGNGCHVRQIWVAANQSNQEGKEEQAKETAKQDEYNPIYCDHKKASGFSAYDLLSHSSGGGREFNLRVCLKCGEVRISGKNLVDNKWEHFDEEFSLYYPDAVAAIVKNCNYMNTETDGYLPFIQQSLSAPKV